MRLEMQGPADPRTELIRAFGEGPGIETVEAPGRVNLIGEHIDYHGLPVLPMAIGRRIRLAFRRRPDARIRACSGPYGVREFSWVRGLEPVGPGDWENYIRAAARAVEMKWGVGAGLDAAVTSDLPPAAGLSSSSALLIAFTGALLRVNNISPSFQELMDVLPEAEHFVGTRGGGMDHAAILSAGEGHATLIAFNPVSVRRIALPEGWAFLAAHSLVTAEKSGAARERYNACRAAGESALATLGWRAYRVPVGKSPDFGGLSGFERDCFLHVASEGERVLEAVAAMCAGDAAAFGRLMLDSHASLRDRLRVSCRELGELVSAFMEHGALGARLTGAGFGGCVVGLCRAAEVPTLRSGLIDGFYKGRSGFDERNHLLTIGR